MTVLLWILFGVLVYTLGAGVAYGLCLRTCKYAADGHKKPQRRWCSDTVRWVDETCDHYFFEEPAPTLWPIALVIAVIYVPFWFVTKGASVLGEKIGEIPTREQRAMKKTEERRILQLTLDEERARLRSRVAELEEELGIPHERKELS